MMGSTKATTVTAMAAVHHTANATPIGRREAAGERLQRSVEQQTLL